MQSQAFVPRVIRIAPDLRRCCWYVTLAMSVVAPVMIVISVLERRPVENTIIGCTVVLAIAVASATILQWRLRLDAEGLVRRSWWGRDQWTWEDFASGQIVKRHPFSLRDPRRPWWRRTLPLQYLCLRDQQLVIGVINQHYQLPPAPNVDRVEIQYALRRRAILDSKGIHLQIRGDSREYLWSDLRRVRITRMDDLRRDFKRMLLSLPDEDVELQMVAHQGGSSPSWSNATPDEVNQVVVSNAPSEVLVVDSAFAPSTHREDLEEKLIKTQGKLRELTTILSVFAVLILGCFVWFAVEASPFRALMLAGMIVVHPGAFVAFLYNKQRKNIARQRDELQKAVD